MASACVPRSFGAIAKCVSFSGDFPFHELTVVFQRVSLAKAKQWKLLRK